MPTVLSDTKTAGLLTLKISVPEKFGDTEPSTAKTLVPKNGALVNPK